MDSQNTSALKQSAPSTMSSTVPSSTMCITKLDGKKNFNNWAFAVKCMLIDLDLWDVVTAAVDPNDVDAKRKDQRARAKLCLTCEESVYPVIRSAKTAHETFN
ncbi:unnamed protein product [Plutella xylostella]|uniref:(diamondback moth) hypothetical protein n=1 Tax=Plutella xylostella TaxID=51655 RepID=A0A8S4G7R0_PLUXY|nr:unnamed protein product [Plutella xylostella]